MIQLLGCKRLLASSKHVQFHPVTEMNSGRNRKAINEKIGFVVAANSKSNKMLMT